MNEIKKFLIVVDIQNDFVSGALGSKEAKAIVPNVVKKVKEAMEDPNIFIIFTQDTHGLNYLKTNEGKHLPVKHCIRLTTGWELVDELREIFNLSQHDLSTDKTACIEKETFGTIKIGQMINSVINVYSNNININDIDIEIIGLCTDICVVSNALILKTRYRENNISVDASCCAGTTIENHKAALAVMKSCQIDIINE